MDIPSNATQIHHITNEMVKTAPKFPEVATMMINMVNTIASPQDIVVMFAHNGLRFDEPILKEQFNTYNIPIPDNWRFADTLPILRQLSPSKEPKFKRPHSLENVYKREFKANPPASMSHRAGGDVQLLEACLRKVIKEDLCKGLIDKMLV